MTLGRTVGRICDYGTVQPFELFHHLTCFILLCLVHSIYQLNFNYAVALLMEYAAFFKLRISRPELERPYRIPLNTFGCVIFFLPAIACTLTVMLLATYTTIAFAIGSYITGLAVFYCKNKSKVQRPTVTSYELVEETPDATSEVATASTSHTLT